MKALLLSWLLLAFLLLGDRVAGQVSLPGDVSAQSIPVLQKSLGQGVLAFQLTGVNFNSANTDNAVTITLPNGFTTYRVHQVSISGASASISTATVGLFTAAAGGGTAIVTAASAVTVTSSAANTNNNMQVLTINNQNTQSFNAATLYFRIATAQGSAATANVTVMINPVS